MAAVSLFTSWSGRGLAAAAVTLALVVPLTGCDRTSVLEESVSTEVQVRKEFGEPRTITVEADGSRTFDYPRQPEGWTNYVIKIGADGKVTSIRQLLTPDNFAKVTPGLTQLEVQAILGRPAKMVPYALKKERCGTGVSSKTRKSPSCSASPLMPGARCCPPPLATTRVKASRATETER